MELTDPNAPWRAKRLNPDQYPRAGERAIAINYNYLADRDTDVAMLYLVTGVGNKASGPINNTGMAKELVGPEGGQIISRYLYGVVGGWQPPFISVRDGKFVDVGTPHRNARGQTNGIVVTATYELPELDLSQRATRKVFAG